jgi:hypothetical protein
MKLVDKLRNNKYMTLIPEKYKENENFLVFFYLLITQFNINEENIRNFTDLINNDKVPMKFLQNLGAFVNYSYQHLAKNDFNRELSMRMHNIWEQRGSKKSIVDAATYGDNIGWVGGDLWIPGYYKPSAIAGFELPRDRIFRHSVSKFSSTHVFEDGKTYMPGVILLSVPNLTRLVKKRIYEVTPAGRKYIFQIESSFFPNDGIDKLDIGSYNELSFYKRMRVYPKDINEENPPYDRDTDIDFTYEIDMMANMDEFFNILIHSENRGKKYHSGHLTNITNYGYEMNMSASMLPVSFLSHKFPVNGNDSLHDNAYKKSKTGEYLDTYNNKGIDSIMRNISLIDDNNVDLDVHREVRLTAIRSESSSSRSGNGKMSGITSSIVDAFVESEPILPSDCLYSVDDVADLNENSFRDEFYSSGVQINGDREYPWRLSLTHI